MKPRGHRHEVWRASIAYLVFCISVFVLSTSGRIAIPDDEIVFQTTQSLWEQHSLAIEGTPRRAGEVKGQKTGTFGWAQGPDGKRYGFFGHALSIVALPAYVAGKAAAARAPAQWRFAVRSDHFWLRGRSQADDWPRLVVGLTNCWITALAGMFLIAWVRTLGFRWTTAFGVGLVFAFGTLSWPYTRTFLSEPLSQAMLLFSALAIAQFHRHREDPRTIGAAHRWLLCGATVAGLSVHAHIINLIAAPCLVGYAAIPVWRDGSWRNHRLHIWLAAGLGTAAVLALGASQWSRFGDPLETGRYGIYSTFIAPGESLAALAVSPGRSLWLTAPALLVAAFGLRSLLRRAPSATWFAIAIVLSRLVFVAARSDWWGGWAIGPRFLVPCTAFALLPLAALWEAPLRRNVRVAVVLLIAMSVVMMGHLAGYSIVEWMAALYRNTPEGKSYIGRSNWEFAANPLLGYRSLQPDLLFHGAVRFARQGTAGLMWIGIGLGTLAAAAATSLVLSLRRLRRLRHDE